MSGTPPTAAGRDSVTISLPAQSAYLTVLRTATAALAARLDFTIDDIEDLRIAVDEACALLLAGAVDGTSVTSVFELDPDAIEVRLSTESADGQVPPQDTFAWTVLTALAGEVDSWVEAGRVTVRLRKARPQHAAAAQP